MRDAARWRRLLVAVAVAAGLLAFLVAGTAPAVAASARSAVVSAQSGSDGDLVVSGSVRARRRDVFVLYLARRCAATVRAARAGHYVIATGRMERGGRDAFRGAIAASEVRPKRGRACYLLADSRRRTKVRASAAYRVR